MEHHTSVSESHRSIETTMDNDDNETSSLTTVTSSSSLKGITVDIKPCSFMRRSRSCCDNRAPAVESHPPAFLHQESSLSTRPSKSRRRDDRRRRPRRSRWLIPSDHPMKILWDFLTVLLSVAYIYLTHTSIRDRSFRQSNIGLICDAWFLVDILLNFVTEYRTEDGLVLRQGKAVWARYLTSWFVVDALSLVPWESLYVKPIVEMQNRRRWFKKCFFRTRAFLRFSRLLRGRHLRLFGRVAKHTRHAGVGANRLLRLLIKYVPKYLLFYRNMKGVLAVRLLRQVHWFRKCMRNLTEVKRDDATGSLTFDDDDDDYYLEDEDDDDDSGIVHIQYNEEDLDDGIGLY